MRVELLIIDPQRDFHDIPEATLGVPGACEDAKRLSVFIGKHADKLDDIHVSLDTHQRMAIFHPMPWVNNKGKNPNPFDEILLDDFGPKGWHAFNPTLDPIFQNYLEQLKVNGRYTLRIWPYHCLVGHSGGNVYEPIAEALGKWESKFFAKVDYVAKGHSSWTEHYSIVQADVPDPNDPTTLLNTRLINTLESADLIFIAGQASSHCLANTGRDIVANFGADSIKKLVFLTDATSPVPGCESMADEFFRDMKNAGATLMKTTEVTL